MLKTINNYFFGEVPDIQSAILFYGCGTGIPVCIVFIVLNLF